MQEIRRLLKIAGGHRKLLFLGVGLLFISNIIRLVFPLFNGPLVEDVLIGGQTEKLWPIIIWMLVLTAARAATFYYRNIAIEQASQNVLYDIRTGLYDHLQKMPYEFYDKHRIGEIMSRLTGDLEAVRNFFAGGILVMLDNFMFLFSIIFMLVLDWQLTLWTISVAPLIGWLSWRFNQKLRPQFIAVREQNAVLNNRTQENISGVRVVKAFAREDYEIERFEKDNHEKRNLQWKAAQIRSNYAPMLNFLGAFMLPVMLLVGGLRVSQGLLDMGTLVIFTHYIWMVTNPMRALSGIVNMLTQTITSCDKVFYYADLGSSIREKDEPVVLERVSGHIRFDNVSFAYGDDYVLKDINLDVPAGMTVAVMGETGSGKSTLVTLLGRFYDVSRGRITMDGVDIRDMGLKQLRSHMGYVMQEAFLFSETIAANVAFGQSEAGMERIQAAADVAQASEFIDHMPYGYDTIVGERGMGLSGGQKQRAALARAVLIDPTVLILDDATSAVDMETEELIQQRLEGVMKGRTTFIIAHRISSVRKADLIIVMDKGQIAERGTHDELLALGGRYYGMFMDQYGDIQAV